MVSLAAWLTAMTAVLFGAGQSSSGNTVAAAQSAAPAAGTYTGSAACARCHAPIYDRWKQTRMANVVRDPKEHPDAIIPDLSRAGSAAHVHAGRYRLRLRQQVEAALLHEGRRRLLSAAGAMGRHASPVGGPTSSRPAPTGGRRSIRPTTCSVRRGRSATAAIRSTTTSRPRPSRSGTSAARNATGPGSDHVARPFAQRSSTRRGSITIAADDVCIQCHSQGQPLTQSDRGQILRLAGRLPRRPEPERLLEARGAQARRDDVHAFRRRHRAQEPDAGQRLRAERDVHARRHLLQLPRCRTAPSTTPIWSSRARCCA